MQKRRDVIMPDESHDPTRPTRKFADPTVCPKCGATYIEGRWTWRHGPVEAPRHLCSACERIRDHYPAGFVTARGRFAVDHHEEIVRLVRNLEKRESETHPIKRIIEISKGEDEISITTTEIRLAQSIGRALHAAFKGEVTFDFEEDIIRVRWERNE